MFYIKKVIALLLVWSGLLYAQSAHIKSIGFEGNEKIKTKTLQKITNEYIGLPLTQANAQKVLRKVEAFYHEHNYALAYASISKLSEEDQTLKISIKKHADFNARSLYEMRQKPINEGKINQIFFQGNEKLSTNRLSNFITPMLGKENNGENQVKILQDVQNLYRKNGYELVYTELETATDGILVVLVKKYPNFKARLAKEGKIN